jgi:hypothetical protein
VRGPWWERILAAGAAAVATPATTWHALALKIRLLGHEMRGGPDGNEYEATDDRLFESMEADAIRLAAGER